MVNEDELPAARRALDDAVQDLIGVQARRDEHGTYTAPSLLTQFQQALRGDQPRDPGNRPGFESHPTAWITGIDKMHEIQTKLTEWAALIKHDGREDPHSLLDALARYPWEPDRVEAVEALSERIRAWCVWIVAAFEDRTAGLRGDTCPECQAGPWTWRHIGGERIRVSVLNLHKSGYDGGRVECIVCGYTWAGLTAMRVLGRRLDEQRAATDQAARANA
ncbi:DUF7341 domain-containing protein [Tsukamurella ocularis]